MCGHNKDARAPTHSEAREAEALAALLEIWLARCSKRLFASSEAKTQPFTTQFHERLRLRVL